ncbi:MAG: proprotein convertase P-domain-containing protein [Phycisphaerae bacterium]
MSGKQRVSFLAAGAAIGILTVGSAMGSETNHRNCLATPFGPECPGIGIPDNTATGLTIQLDVPSDGENYITDLNVSLYVNHTWQGDLRMVLTSPAGTSVELVNRPGAPGCGGNGFNADNFGRVDAVGFFTFNLNDQATNPYNTPAVACPGIANTGGAWNPHTPLSAFNGQSKVGPWRLLIQDLAGSDVGSFRYLQLNIHTEPATPPIAQITMPDDYACGCSNGAITGTAADPDGTFGSYRLDWSVDSDGPWILIAANTAAVTNGVLGTFPADMPEGYSYVRLRATNLIGLSSTFVLVVAQDRTFGGAAIIEPQDGDIVGGNVCLNKVVASDYCFESMALAYAPQGGGFTTYFSSTSPPSELPAWSTGALVDGNYTFRVSGTTICGNTADDSVSLIIDNTAPVAFMTSPLNCAQVGDSVAITGTVTDLHLSGWTLQYTGGPTHGWQTIASGNEPVLNGLLTTWNTSGLPACSYTLRLLASDQSAVSCLGSNGTEYLTSVEVGDNSAGDCIADISGDGAINLTDLAYLLAVFGTSCP